MFTTGQNSKRNYSLVNNMERCRAIFQEMGTLVSSGYFSPVGSISGPYNFLCCGSLGCHLFFSAFLFFFFFFFFFVWPLDVHCCREITWKYRDDQAETEGKGWIFTPLIPPCRLFPLHL